MKPRLGSAAILLSALAAAFPGSAPAADLGVRGAAWPIAEPDLLGEIEARLAHMRRSGKLASFEAQARARSRLEQPAPVPGIAPARERRTRLFDAAIVVERDIRLPGGTLIAAAGARVNPLARHPLTRGLLFIDGRRPVEVGWALAYAKPAKIVLLAGRPLDLVRSHGRPFFFDQGGRLAARLGLRFTPALVEQAGTALRITEIPVEDPDDPGPAARNRGPEAGTGSRDPGSGAGPKPQRED